MRWLIVIGGVAAYLWAYGLPGSFSPYKYKAEVSYYVGRDQTWYVGGDTSYDTCISEARAMFNSYNASNPGRAFSWGVERCRVIGF